MTRYTTLNHLILPMISWNPDQPAEAVLDHIAMVRATSNAYVVTGDDGDVVINTGPASVAPKIREKFEQLLCRPLSVAKVVFTQSHPDHTGGWKTFADRGAEMIGQRTFRQICAERKALGEFFGPRNANVLAAMMPPGAPTHGWFDTPDPEPLKTFADKFEFTVSGRPYVLISMPSGETLDSLAVWLPEEQTVFTGNWAGAIHGALPNFCTARGDRDRSIPGWLRDYESLMALEPELLITGHEQPIVGKRRIVAELGKVRDAVQHIHDHVVRGMTGGQQLPEIMSTLRLPEDLTPRDGRCPPHWIARSVWEEYAGWFGHRHSSELYQMPASAVWPEVVEMAGGASKLADTARDHLRSGDLQRALHLIEMAVEGEPDNRAVREIELAIYDALADETEGKVFDLLGWLEGRMIHTRNAIAAIDNAEEKG